MSKAMEVLLEEAAKHNHPYEEAGFLYSSCPRCHEVAQELSKDASPIYEPKALSTFVVKDTGKRQEFSSGMVRNNADDKVDYTSVLDGPMFKRWAEHLTKAKKLYPDVAPGVANWTQASSEEELVRFKKSALRHFLQWYWGDVDEDHAAAVMFNMNGAEFVKAKQAGKKAA